MPIRLGCIVEGHGEVDALPILVRRMAAILNPPLDLQLNKPWRMKRTQMVRPGELERTVGAIARQIGRSAPILVLLDADTDCPAELAQRLLERCRKEHRDVFVSVVVAKCEYEAWFLAAAESLAGRHGLPDDLTPPVDPEAIRDAKGWLYKRMPQGGGYDPMLHQAKFSRLMDINQARRSRSFRKFEKEIRNVISEHPASM